jgi:hypothetical protein
MRPLSTCFCSSTFLVRLDKLVASSRSSSKGSTSRIEGSGTTSATLTFLVVGFLAAVLTSFLPEVLTHLGEAVGSTSSSTLGDLCLAEVQTPCSEEAGSKSKGG